ncbi:MAG: alpha/beta fold hydrolase [Archangiaceae bacterium]|nr:alpha/beta fold hydrolase [Archangiaceae bacterium]
MTASPEVDPKNSTTVRFSLTGLAEWLAPRFVLDRAFEAWCTPPRPKKPRPPREGRPFELDTPVGTLKAWEWGMRDDGETVLLVHGWGGSAVSMEKLARPLAEGGRQVVAMDLPAHGLNPSGQTNLLELTRAVEAALWRFRPTAVIGHSFGASATALALERGPKVEKVALLAPGEDIGWFAHAFAVRAGLSQGIALGLLTRIEQRVGISPDRLSLRHHVPPASTEVLVLHDPADLDVPVSHAQKLAEAWPAARVVAIDGVGHHGLPRHAAVIGRLTDWVSAKKAP